MDPPVSVANAKGASEAATAAAEPPLEPPGTRPRSHGLRVVLRAEYSVEDPRANSSIFVLPKIGIPAAFKCVTTVASYGGTKSASIFEADVVRTPSVHRLSLSAIGTPSSAGVSPPFLRRLSASRSEEHTSAL